jgi:uncharacterized protein (DUF2147 family)
MQLRKYRITAGIEFLFAAIAVVAIAGLASPSAAASDIFGVWSTEKDNGHVAIMRCGDAICGRVIDAKVLHVNPAQTDIFNPDRAKRARPLLGLVVLQGYRGGDGEWFGGMIYDPQTGIASGDSRLMLTSPDTLMVEGCRAVLCKSQTWTRVRNAPSSPHG